MQGRRPVNSCVKIFSDNIIIIKAMLGMLGGGENLCGWLFIIELLSLVSLHEDMTKLISVRGRTLQLEHRLLNHL